MGLERSIRSRVSNCPRGCSCPAGGSQRYARFGPKDELDRYIEGQLGIRGRAPAHAGPLLAGGCRAIRQYDWRADSPQGASREMDIRHARRAGLAVRDLRTRPPSRHRTRPRDRTRCRDGCEVAQDSRLQAGSEMNHGDLCFCRLQRIRPEHRGPERRLAATRRRQRQLH